MRRFLLLFFMLLSVAGFTQPVTPVLYPRFEGAGHCSDPATNGAVPGFSTSN